MVIGDGSIQKRDLFFSTAWCHLRKVVSRMTRTAPAAAELPVETLISEVYRFNGRLLAIGDKLGAKVGLTSARWQVLAAIAVAPVPEPVARLARNHGLTRQGVQRIVNELAAEGVVDFQENPHHRRAKLITLTKKGEAVYEATTRIQKPLMNALAKGIETEGIIAASRIIRTLRKRLEGKPK
jgi:DNA-binding MarR family transcriptional regulator